MTTITITLPEELAEQARAKGLLSSEAIEAYVREKLREAAAPSQEDGMPADAAIVERLGGLVNPAAFRKGQIVGDIVGPFCEEWGEDV